MYIVCIVHTTVLCDMQIIVCANPCVFIHNLLYPIPSLNYIPMQDAGLTQFSATNFFRVSHQNEGLRNNFSLSQGLLKTIFSIKQLGSQT